jgi:hypothetical protein
MAQPIALVRECDGCYTSDAEGLAFLRQQTGALAVIVVAGRYRTGKSFLLNRGVLNLPPRQGFQTGNTINACTKGIWAHPECVTVGDGQRALVLDTEGTGSMEASPEQDAKLLSVAVSMASLFIYNSTGALDESSFSEVGVLAHAAKRVEHGAGVAWNAPALIWALRDFSLILQNENGEPLTADAYLERSLLETEKGEARQLLRTYFSRRCLIPFVRPVADERQLQRLDDLPEEDLRCEFVEQLKAFRSSVAVLAGPKLLGGKTASGDVLAHLCESAVAAVNRGAVPAVSDSLSFLLEQELLSGHWNLNRVESIRSA